MYNEKVMSIFRKPKHAGRLIGADAVGEVGNAACGDIMKIYIKLKDGIIKDAKFQTFGCAAAIASTDTACSLIIGKTLKEALEVKNTHVLEVLGDLPQPKIHCSILAEEVIEAAHVDYLKRLEKEAKKKNKQ